MRPSSADERKEMTCQ